ncbi:hypothetical protein EVAR_14414_1 [Eumeta japonica]|uniref:Uncharacterized protein n=1 Tax=Eumeta variegata TaxID=151549 RepID=A0A4C1TXP3_EUMVA|nr:hypothetical protein EVAR_14414_1 [Eumeta japonica]
MFKDFVHLTNTDAYACPNLLIGHSFVSHCHEPHSTDIVFDHRRRRTSVRQIVSQISTTTCELVKLVINPGREWSFIMKGQPKSSMAFSLA